MIEPTPSLIDYAQIAREAVPTLGGCFDCDSAFTGALIREEAYAHAKARRHMVWLECRPA
jgi:hypothetical protein